MKRYFTFIFAMLCTLSFASNSASDSARVLFIGNSYTAVNNLPQLFTDVATSAGKYVFVDSNTPGGYTFQMQSTDATTTAKIMQGGWDYVVIQGQSQEPSFPDGQFFSDTYPYAITLNNMIKTYNPCAKTVFYMTWGRKNGDAGNCASFPPLCTYQGMDSLLHLRYCLMADSTHGLVSPVGAAWHSVRDNYPTLELYQSDESHPTVAGSYIAACSFYSVIFKSDPTLITNYSGLAPSDAQFIQNTVKTIVYDSLLKWNVGKFLPVANFSYTNSNNYTVNFTNLSTDAINYIWDFGDGNTSTLANPTHTYGASGTYNITLKAIQCNLNNTINYPITILPSFINENKPQEFKVTPNPVSDKLIITSDCFAKEVYQIKITNAMGMLVYEGSSTLKKEQSIDVRNLKNGAYFISIINKDKQTFNLKVVKK